MDNMCKMQVNFICASKNTRTNAPSGRLETIQVLALFSVGVLRMRAARGILCTYNWMGDYTLIMLVHKIM